MNFQGKFSQQEITQLINDYFGKLVFVKVEQKESFIIYGACVSSSYADGKRQYVLAFVPVHLAIKNQAYLNELAWQNLQTRLISTGNALYKKLISQKWDYNNKHNLFFKLKQRTDTYSQYVSEEGYPYELLLIHDSKKKTKYQYYDRTNLYASLNTFACVLNYVGNISPLNFTSLLEGSERFGNDINDSFELIS